MVRRCDGRGMMGNWSTDLFVGVVFFCFGTGLLSIMSISILTSLV